MHNDRFYGMNQKYDVTRSLEKHQDDFTRKDQEILERYLNYKVDVDKVAPSRKRKAGFTLIMIKGHLSKSWDKATIDDYNKTLSSLKDANIKTAKNVKSKPYSWNTRYDATVILKNFLKWMVDEKLTKITVEEIDKKIKSPKKDDNDIYNAIRPEDLLTEDEIYKMASCTNSQRDRALILITYETGARIGEISRLTFRDIIFELVGDENDTENPPRETAKIYITDTKTNKRRYGRVTNCAPDLILLKNQIKPINDDIFVFTESKGDPMTYPAMSRVFTRAAKKAGITKPVRPHLLRHARATQMIRDNIQESIIKQTLWNNLDTKMFKVYMSLGDQDIDREMFRHMGIKDIRADKDKKNKDKHMPKMCGNCHTVNTFDASYCSKCGMALSKDAISDTKAITEDAKASPEYKDLLTRLEEMQQQILALQSKK